MHKKCIRWVFFKFLSYFLWKTNSLLHTVCEKYIFTNKNFQIHFRIYFSHKITELAELNNDVLWNRTMFSIWVKINYILSFKRLLFMPMFIALSFNILIANLDSIKRKYNHLFLYLSPKPNTPKNMEQYLWHTLTGYSTERSSWHTFNKQQEFI